MKRYSVIKYFLECLDDDDVVVLSGEGIGKEAFQYDRDGYFYVVDSFGLAPSLALGLAMVTRKRVFVLVDDADFIAELSSGAQMSISQCKNISYIVLNSGFYQDESNLPTICSNIKTMKVLLYGLGFVFYDFTNYFKNKSSRENMKRIIKNLKGPTAILVNVDKGINKKIKKLKFSKEKMRDRIYNFISK